MEPSSSLHLACPNCGGQGRRDLSGEIPTPAGIVRPIMMPESAGAKYDEEVATLCRLEAENRRPGADLRDAANEIVTHSKISDWLEKSDELTIPKILRGRADLTRQRRRGILRLLEGEDRGFPISQPFPRHSVPEGQGYWLMRLRDELEWLVLPVFTKNKVRPYPRPVKDRLNHREARAILDWKASHLDMWLTDRPHLIGGRLAIDASRGVIFDTEAFIRWVYALMN